MGMTTSLVDVKTLVAALMLLLLGACGIGGPSSGRAGSGDPEPSTGAVAACDEVVAGIEAFNAGDFDATVAHFQKAIPLAEAEAKADDSIAARDLLEAVHFYADLAPRDYLESSQSSPEFAKYKKITLGQCPPGAPPPSPGTPSDDDSGGVLA